MNIFFKKLHMTPCSYSKRGCQCINEFCKAIFLQLELQLKYYTTGQILEVSCFKSIFNETLLWSCFMKNFGEADTVHCFTVLCSPSSTPFCLLQDLGKSSGYSCRETLREAVKQHSLPQPPLKIFHHLHRATSDWQSGRDESNAKCFLYAKCEEYPVSSTVWCSLLRQF